jgi:hypothetical protein
MVKSILTPTHSGSFKSLLNQPFTGTLYHTATNGQTLFFKPPILDVVDVDLQVISHLAQNRLSHLGRIFRLA